MGRISAVALGATLMIATATAAVAQQGGNGQHRGRHDGARMGADRSESEAGRSAPLRALLRNVHLTDAQKHQVKAIRERYQPRYKALRDSLRPAAEQARAARQRGDTAAARQAWAQGADGRRQLMALAHQEASEVRAMLTPDQQRTFDENLAARREHARDAMRDRARDGKHDGRARQRPGR